MKDCKTKHNGYKIETSELDDGTVDIHVGKEKLFQTTWVTTATRTFDNHTQAIKFAKDSIDSGEIDSVFNNKP